MSLLASITRLFSFALIILALLLTILVITQKVFTPFSVVASQASGVGDTRHTHVWWCFPAGLSRLSKKKWTNLV